MAIVSAIIRVNEKQTMKEKKDLLKLAHAIQRYYWLMKKGKITEAQQKALRKTVYIFANRVVNADQSSVEIALQSFVNDIFSDFKERVKNIRLSYRNQFAKMPTIGNDSETSNDFFPMEDIVTTEEAVNQINTSFEKLCEK